MGTTGKISITEKYIKLSVGKSGFVLHVGAAEARQAALIIHLHRVSSPVSSASCEHAELSLSKTLKTLK